MIFTIISIEYYFYNRNALKNDSYNRNSLKYDFYDRKS